MPKGKSKAAPDIVQTPTTERAENTKSEVPLAVESPTEIRTREEFIRDAAYRRFEARGSEHGSDEDDWLEAEKEVRPPAGN